MEKRIVISKSKFRRRSVYTEMVVYVDTKKGTSKTKHEACKDQTRIFHQLRRG